MTTSTPPAATGQGPATLRAFYKVLVNTALANITTSFLWYALTFWVYLETRSVLATAIIGGSYMLLVAIFGMVFGAIVDRIRKKSAMLLSSSITLVTYFAAGTMFLLLPESALVDWGGGWFWLYAGVILFGGVVEHMRNIALSTTVTLLVPGDRRDRANGLVGTVQGIAFIATGALSGLSVGILGMGWTNVIAICLTAVALAHLLTVPIREPQVISTDGGTAGSDPGKRGLGLRQMIPAVIAVPGLLALILFSTFNNLVGGVFMALMDPYGLTLFPVELWGIVLGVTGTGFIIGGALVAKFGLGANPVRTMLLVNIGIAILGLTFAARELWWLYALGIWFFMCLMPIAEATEQTIIQRVVPYKLQGRVFGFAMSVETSAAPISAFLIGPIAEFWLIPYMDSTQGQQTFGWLVGQGEARGIALAFMGASLLMLVVVALAFVSPQYRRLSRTYAETPPQDPEADATTGGEASAAETSNTEPSQSTASHHALSSDGLSNDGLSHDGTRHNGTAGDEQAQPSTTAIEAIGEAGESIRDTLR